MTDSLIISKRNRQKYAHKNYAYFYNGIKKDGKILFWRCDRTSLKCPGRIWTTVEGEFIKMITEHQCDSSNKDIELKKLKTFIKQQANETTETPKQILQNASLEFGIKNVDKYVNEKHIRNRRSKNKWRLNGKMKRHQSPIIECQLTQLNSTTKSSNNNDDKMRKNTEQPNLEQQQDNFTFKLDVSGYCPELLNVKMQGNEVIIYGEHYEQNQDESEHRQFVRRVILPDDIKKDSIKCEYDGGYLCISAKRDKKNGDGSIPIQIKKGRCC